MSNILPNSLIKRLGVDPFFDEEAVKIANEKGEKPVSIRLNPNKSPECDFDLSDPIPWCDQGFLLNSWPKFHLDPLFYAGSYFIQDSSSMFISHILKSLKVNEKNIKVLDLCSGIGENATLINSSISPNSLLVANEMIKSKSVLLQENLMRWGYANVVVTNNDSSAFNRLPGFFDIVSVNAPSSGSAAERKDEHPVDEWEETNVKLCSERQQRILKDVLPSISTNGYLLYSTCSYTAEENEDILDWLIDEYKLESIQIPVNAEWGIEESISTSNKAYGYRFHPNATNSKTYFIAVLQVRNIQPGFSIKKMKLEKSPISKESLQGWIDLDRNFSTLIHNDNVHIFPTDHQTSIKALQQVLYLKNAGTIVGKWLGKEIVPAHDLAMSINKDKKISYVNLSLEEAREYMGKRQLNDKLFEDVKRGWCLMNYKNVSLGWVKVLGNRINNYYPKEIRISNS